MKILRKQKKNKSSITMRSVSILWLVAYLFNCVFFHVDTSNFTLDALMPFETEFTGKYKYEVKNDSSCEVQYESNDLIGADTIETKFDKGVSIKNTFYETGDGSIKNKLTISTNKDSAYIGTYESDTPQPVILSVIFEKVISKKDYNVYYVKGIEDDGESIFKTVVAIVFKNGKIKILDDKEFQDISKEKDKKLKKIKLSIMKNEMVGFFDGYMFISAFKGLWKIDSEKKNLNLILKEYKIKKLIPKKIKEEREFFKDSEEIKPLEYYFDFCLDKAFYLKGDRLNISAAMNAVDPRDILRIEKIQDIIERYSKNDFTKKGLSYYLKDMIFTYNDKNELMEVIIKKPIVYYEDTQLIGAKLSEIQNKFKKCTLKTDTIELNGNKIKILDLPCNWTIIADSNGIIKSAILRPSDYYFDKKKKDINTNNPYEKIKLYDEEIKDFSLL